MRKALAMIGLLLFLPSTVLAQADRPALSPWVEEILKKADAGISAARGTSAGSCEDSTIITELENNLSAVRTMSLSVPLGTETSFLRDKTVCVESDRRLILAKLEETLEALEQVTRDCKQQGAAMLRKLYSFLAEAYFSFVLGSTDPSYQDERLRFRYAFEDPSLPSEGSPVPIEDADLPLCPYTSDYAPHSIAYIPTAPGLVMKEDEPFEVHSYGCDKDVLSTLPGSVQAEVQPLLEFMQRTEDFAYPTYTLVKTAIMNINRILAILAGIDIDDPLPDLNPPPTHAVRSGCLRPLSPFDASDDASPSVIEKIMLAFPEYFDPPPPKPGDALDSATAPESPKPEEVLPEGLLFRPTTDFFAVLQNPLILSRAMSDRMRESGRRRPLKKWYFSEIFDNFYTGIDRSVVTSNATKIISGNIDQEVGQLSAFSRDAIERTQEASRPLREAVISLVHVTEEFLPKQYIPNVGYFLARSCVDGHCQRTLDTVLKRTFNPYCHPYVSGKFTDEKAHLKCYCDTSIRDEDPGFFDEYCSPSFNPGDYPPEGEVFPTCKPDSEQMQFDLEKGFPEIEPEQGE